MVLCLSQDGACTESFENCRDNSLKGGLSNDITLTPPLFSLVNTFNIGSAEFDRFLQVLTLASHWLEDCANFTPTPEENDQRRVSHS